MHFLKNGLLLFLTAWLLLSSTGFTMHKHYCMGRLKSVAFFHEAAACFDGERQDATNNEEASGCCEDTTQELKVEDYQKNQFELDIAPMLYSLGMIQSILFDFDPSESEEFLTFQKAYKPPLIDQNVPILVQSFLL